MEEVKNAPAQPMEDAQKADPKDEPEVATGAPSTMEERLDDLEDLIMVEQAGIMELKKMLEAAPAVQVPEGLEERLSKVEQTVSGVQAPVAAAVTPELEGRLSRLEQSLSALQTRPAGTGLPPDLESRIQSLAKDVSLVKQQMAAVGRIDVIEKTVSGFSQEVARVRPMMERMESVEKFADMRKEVADRLAETNKTKDEIARIAESASSASKQLEGRIADVNRVAGSVKDISDRIRGFNESYDRILGELKTKSAAELRESVEKIEKDIESSKDEFRKSVAGSVSEAVKQIRGVAEKSAGEMGEVAVKLEKLRTIEEDVSKQAARIEVFYNTMSKKLDSIKGMEGKLPELMEEIAGLNKEINKLRVDIADRTTRADVSEKLKEFSDDLNKSIKQYQADIAKKVMSVEGKVESLKPDDIRLSMQTSFAELSKRLEAKMSEFESSVNQSLAEIQKPVMDEQIKQLLEKTVQLETRILALEKVARQAATISPIVLE